MAKTGKTPHEFNEEEILVMINTATKIATRLQKIKEIYREPKMLASEALKGLNHKKNIASFILFLSDFILSEGSVISLYILSSEGRFSSKGSIKNTMWLRIFNFCSIQRATLMP
jgi:hypothetical protein